MKDSNERTFVFTKRAALYCVVHAHWADAE